jgi:hypothetical protein
MKMLKLKIEEELSAHDYIYVWPNNILEVWPGREPYYTKDMTNLYMSNKDIKTVYEPIESLLARIEEARNG